MHKGQYQRLRLKKHMTRSIPFLLVLILSLQLLGKDYPAMVESPSVMVEEGASQVDGVSLSEEISHEDAPNQEDPLHDEEHLLEDMAAEGHSDASIPSSPVPSLGSWVDYNGIVFGNAVIYQSKSGGGLAVADAITIQSNYEIGSTYTPLYDPTKHIGEYKNETGYPALLFGGSQLNIASGVTSLNVSGGPIAMSADSLAVNSGLPIGFQPNIHSYYGEVDPVELANWFTYQHKIVQTTSQLLLKGNDTVIQLSDLGSGSYMENGPEAFENRYFQIDGEVYKKALFVNVQTGSEVNFGQWWPVHSVITMDVNWALDYDLLVFNFPDAVNVTMNSSTFQINNMSHWSTTVDAWIGEVGQAERLALAEKVVYNFPNARTVEATQALIQGTLLAPNASFTGIGSGDSGHIYGHIAVKNFQARGDFTIHAFNLTRWVYDIVEDILDEEKNTGSIHLRQYLYFKDEPTRIRVSGGDFILNDEAGKYFDGKGSFVEDIGQAAIYTTTASAYTTISDVPLGSYTLRHLDVPDGFIVNDSDQNNENTFYEIPVTISTQEEAIEVVRYMEPILTDITFKKISQTDSTGIEGAVFTLIRDADEYGDATVVNTYTSGENGLFTCRNLPIGTYHLLETEIPEGFQLIQNGESGFSVTWNSEAGQLQIFDESGVWLSADDEDPIEILNREGPLQNSLLILKYADSTPGENSLTLSRAEFALFLYEHDMDSWLPITETSNGEPVELITDHIGVCRVKGLSPGTYRIAEIKAPQGHGLVNQFTDEAHPETFPNGYAYEFAFQEKGSHYTALIPNNPLTTDIRLLSLGPVAGEPTPLSNDIYKLEHLLDDGITWEEIAYSAASGLDGQILFSDLGAGSYRLTQLLPASGYYPMAPSVIRFSISFDEVNNPICSAVYNGYQAGSDTYPVSLDTTDGIQLTIESEAKTRGLTLYKIDGDYTSGTDESGNTTYTATYLDGAQFRLQRRADSRSPWRDYGPAITSEYQYDSDGQPVLDAYGNHIASASLEMGLLYGNYMLYETKAPEGYRPTSKLEMTLEDGTTGYLVHEFSVLEYMTGEGQATTHMVFDYALDYTTQLRFRMVDANNHDLSLPDAEFALYSCTLNHEHDTHLSEAACWSINTPDIEYSGTDGAVTFDGITTGSYWLVETKAPQGYSLPKTQWRIEADAPTGAFDFRPTSGTSPGFIFPEDESIFLPNQKKYALPHMGGQGTFWFLVTGIILISLAILILGKKIFFPRRKK